MRALTAVVALVLVASCMAISGRLAQHKRTKEQQGVLAASALHGADDWNREQNPFAAGAFGKVYHATAKVGGKQVVIKMIKVVDANPVGREMTVNQVKLEIGFQQAVAQACPGAAGLIFDSWEENGQDGKYYALVMEPLIEIPNLAASLQTPVDRLENLGIEFMTKLMCMNKAGYMHNDLKVDNMMGKIDGHASGPVRIVDFGKTTKMAQNMDPEIVERRPRLITTLMNLIYGMTLGDLLKDPAVVQADPKAMEILTLNKPFNQAVTTALDTKFGALGAPHWAWINGIQSLTLKKSEAIAAAKQAMTTLGHQPKQFVLRQRGG